MNKKIILSAISVVLISTVLITGCSQKQSNANSTKSLKTRSIFFITGNTGGFNPEWPVFKKAEEITGFHLTSVLSKQNTDSATAYNLMLAAGEVADIVGASKMDFIKYIQEDVYVPLNDLIDKHAPNVKKFFEEHPDAKKDCTNTDGKIYFLPYLADGDAETGIFVRRDWMQKLGLGDPKTIDDFYTMMKAFKEKDPNGNGQSDEVPLFQRSKSLRCEFNMYDIYADFTVDPATDSIKFDKYTPKYKTAVAALVKWYNEGIIDKEVYTRAQDARSYLLNNNTGGCTVEWFTSTASFNSRLSNTIPGFDFSPVLPPANIYGNPIKLPGRSKTVGSGVAISQKDPNPEETIEYLDFWYSEQGRRLMNFGIEGDTYTMVDGKPTFTDKLAKNTEMPVLNQLWKIGAQLPSNFGYQADYYYEYQLLDPKVKDAIKQYSDSGSFLKSLPGLTFTKSETDIINAKKVNIDTYINETEQQWIMGAKNVDTTFDEYLASLKKLGIEDLLKVYNDAYKRYKSLDSK